MVGSSSIIVLITGANSGIGYATAQVIASSSPKYHIIIASRTLSKAESAISSLLSSGPRIQGTLSPLALDVTSPSSIQAAAQLVSTTFNNRLDVLINNAGIPSKSPDLQTRLSDTLTTNVIGPALVTEAFAPLLLNSDNPYLINVSSLLGSVERAADKGDVYYRTSDVALAYRVSKAALNMLTVEQGKVLDGKKENGKGGVKTFAVCPGLVRSNLRGDKEEERGAGGNAGDPMESGRLMLSILEGEKDADVGKFLYKGGVHVW
ncbi:short chain dehydrogenase/reductase, putative [Paecilomyces variotii No. 5]|uniref:Short chain dehydrogenase/reductase, putative n=1 Tax=Byssochlamys spectabilis (strain No. 5 / NBRC 109023) TaxID=1356009 RepID=V5FSG8_BYSSN|nr:short chain dehydrogenase/reductase, putative [Paecilomyces variotii No. 5]